MNTAIESIISLGGAVEFEAARCDCNKVRVTITFCGSGIRAEGATVEEAFRMALAEISMVTYQRADAARIQADKFTDIAAKYTRPVEEVAR